MINISSELDNGWVWIQALSLVVTHRCVVAGIHCTKKYVVVTHACPTLLVTDIARPDSREVGSSPYKRRGKRQTHPFWDPVVHYLVISG